jgi:D-alanyl-D-alanine carboxypeptidase (penicillin-binding protein 5/6)
MLLTMSASVQNDTLALALGALTLELALARLAKRPTIRAGLGLGALAGMTVLTKLTAGVVVPAIALWLISRHRRASIGSLIAFLSAVVVVSGWWFVRNGILYGDITGARGVVRTGVSFSVYHVHSWGSIGHIIELIVTYLWLPTEYLRNAFHADPGIKVGVAVLTGLFFAFGLARRQWGTVPSLITLCASLSVLGWILTDLLFQDTAPRVAYMALPFWVGIVAVALSRHRRHVCVVLCAIVVVSLNGWTLYEVNRVSNPWFLVNGRTAMQRIDRPGILFTHSLVHAIRMTGRDV